jgi:hypothetical protein
MADANTITRIGGILKNVYSESIVEQQNLASVARKLFTKAKGVRLGGDHYEISVRIGGNRAGVGARLSDDALPVAGSQQEKKFQVFDRAYFGTIKLFDKDIENSLTDKQAFANTMDDQITQIVKDVMKVMNIDTYGDGTATLATVNANTSSSTAFVCKQGSAFGQNGGLYLQVGDNIDIYDSTLTTLRNSAGGVLISSYEPTTFTVTLASAQTLTAGDIVIRQGSLNKAYVGLQLATDNSSSVTFQNLSRSTYPSLRGNVVDASGAALQEFHLQQIESLVARSSGEEIDQILVGFAQWDAYVSLGQALKRYVGTMKLDRGFTELEYNGHAFTKDVDCPNGTIFAFKSAHVQNGVVTPLSWMDREGHLLKWNSGFASYTGIIREYGNYVYDRPNALGRIQNLAFNASYQG